MIGCQELMHFENFCTVPLIKKPSTQPLFHQKQLFKIGITQNTSNLLQFQDNDTTESAEYIYDIIQHFSTNIQGGGYLILIYKCQLVWKMIFDNFQNNTDQIQLHSKAAISQYTLGLKTCLIKPNWSVCNCRLNKLQISMSFKQVK